MAMYLRTLASLLQWHIFAGTSFYTTLDRLGDAGVIYNPPQYLWFHIPNTKQCFPVTAYAPKSAGALLSRAAHWVLTL